MDLSDLAAKIQKIFPSDTVTVSEQRVHLHVAQPSFDFGDFGKKEEALRELIDSLTKQERIEIWFAFFQDFAYDGIKITFRIVYT